MKRTVLITGSTSGIGKATAIAFAKLGYNIIFNGIESNGNEIAEEIAKAHGVDYLFSSANLANPLDVQQLAQDALQRFGTVDILINNAGIQHVSPIENFADEKWNAILAINLTAAFQLSKALWPGMKEQKFGRIINMASAHGLTASPFKSAYVASKHGIIGLTKALALEGAEYNITVNAVCPGYVHTPIVENQIGDQMKAHNLSREDVIEKVMLAKQAVKEFIAIDVIVDMVLMLAREESKTITGIALPVDGGWTAA
jgi:3-hydroxybutyrate dehydrogenase